MNPTQQATPAGDLAAFFGQQGGAFDTHSVEPQEDFIALPPGDYPVIIDKAELKATKSGDGHLIKLELIVLDGPAKGRKLWDYINIDNPSKTAVEMAMRTLAAVGQAVGLATVSDSQQLVGQMCLAAVKVKGDDNNIRTYKPLPTAAPAAPTAAAPAIAAPTPAAVEHGLAPAPVAAPVAPAASVAAPTAPVAPVTPAPVTTASPAAVAPVPPVAPVAPAAPQGVPPWETKQ